MGTQFLRQLFAIRFLRESQRPRRPRKLLRIEGFEDRLVLTLLGQPVFPADSAWNQNISAAPVAANSAAVIAHIGASTSIHPDWGDDDSANGDDPLYGIPFNIVHGNSTPTVNVVIDNYRDESDIIPVPIPANAVLEGDYQNGPNLNGGGDGDNQRGDSHLLIWDEDNDIAYELYGVSRPNDPTLFPDDNGDEAPKTDTAWHAAQETVWNLKTDDFRTLGDTSADAAGLSILAGLVRSDEGLPVADGGQGAIDHALRLTLPRGDIDPQYIYPASHIVSGMAADTKLPFGARLRLENTPAIDALIQNMPPESQIIAIAMQQYGLILADIGSAMYVTGASATIDNVDSPNTKLTWNTDDDIFASNGLEKLTAGDFQVVDLTPRVTSLSATSSLAGNTLTIHGQNFSGAGGRLSVLFGNVPANPNSVVIVSDSQINVTIPSGSGTVDVTVQSGIVETGSNSSANFTKSIYGYGTSATSAADKFTYLAAPGTLTWNGTSSGNWTAPDWSGTGPAFPDNTANAIVNTASVVQATAPQAAYSLVISNSGQVSLAAGASLSVTNNTSVTAGASLNLAPSATFSTGGTLTLDTGGSLTGGLITAAAFQLNAGTVTAHLAGPGGLTKSTTGTLTLSGTNTYAGPTTIQAGTLIVSSGALPTGTSLIIGGTAGAPVTVTIAASDANGNSSVDSAAAVTIDQNTMSASTLSPSVVRPAQSNRSGQRDGSENLRSLSNFAITSARIESTPPPAVIATAPAQVPAPPHANTTLHSPSSTIPLSPFAPRKLRNARAARGNPTSQPTAPDAWGWTERKT